jgi:hypothetical protein
MKVKGRDLKDHIEIFGDNPKPISVYGLPISIYISDDAIEEIEAKAEALDNIINAYDYDNSIDLEEYGIAKYYKESE